MRSKLPKRIEITTEEKSRLLKFGKLVGTAIGSLITIVSPRTFSRWVKEEKDGKLKKVKKQKTGRPKTESEISELVLKLARENSWGYTRILGELKKLGLGKVVSRSTVVNILKKHGIDPGPNRKKGSWVDFLSRHKETLWSSNFVNVKTLTMKGFVDRFVLFFIHPGSRKVIIAGAITNPNGATEKALRSVASG